MSTVMEGLGRDAGSASYLLPRGLRVNLGCGPVMPKNWMNVDGSRRAWLMAHGAGLDRLLVRLKLLRATAFRPGIVHHDLRRPLPWANDSVAAIYAGEVWEHLEYEDARRLTNECRRVLMTGGVLRLCVPDGVEFWQNYLTIFREEQALEPAKRHVERLRSHVRMYFDDICTRPPGLKSFGHFHKWQYDEVQLVDLCTRSGFKDVGRQAFGVSRIPDIGVLERSNFLIVEGVKP